MNMHTLTSIASLSAIAMLPPEWPRVRRSTLRKYGNAANPKQCAKRRAKNKAARKARRKSR